MKWLVRPMKHGWTNVAADLNVVDSTRVPVRLGIVTTASLLMGMMMYREQEMMVKS